MTFGGRYLFLCFTSHTRLVAVTAKVGHDAWLNLDMGWGASRGFTFECYIRHGNGKCRWGRRWFSHGGGWQRFVTPA